MAKHGPADAFVFVDGYDVLVNKIGGLSSKLTAPQEETTGIGDAWQEHSPTGVKMTEVSIQGGYFDTESLRSHAAFSGSVAGTPESAVRVACLGYAGLTKGEAFEGFEGAFQISYEVSAENGALSKANIEFVMTGEHDQDGEILEYATKTADWNNESASTDYTDFKGQQRIPITANSAASPSVITCPIKHGLTTGDKVLIAGVADSNADINGERVVTVISTTTFSVPVNATTSAGTGGTFVRSDTSNGGYGYQQVTAFSGFSGFVGKVRDSPDDVSYADLGAFADVTSAPAVERITVAVGQVDRYLAFKGDVTGSGSITVFCGFARTP